MLVVMSTYSTSEHGREGFDYAVYKMEVHEARIVARYFNLFKVMVESQPELVEMVFATDQETLCEFYSTDLIDERKFPKEVLENLNGSQGWAVFPENFRPEFEPRYAHCSPTWIVVCKEGFFWRTYPPDSELTIETQVLPRELLSREL